MIDRYIIQSYMKLILILFESLDLKRIKKKISVRKAKLVCLPNILPGSSTTFLVSEVGFLCGWWTSRTLIREVFSDRKLTVKGDYSTETLVVLVRIRIKSTGQRSKELQLAVGSLFYWRQK